MNPLSSDPYSTVISHWNLLLRNSSPSLLTLPRSFLKLVPHWVFQDLQFSSPSNTAPVVLLSEIWLSHLEEVLFLQPTAKKRKLFSHSIWHPEQVEWIYLIIIAIFAGSHRPKMIQCLKECERIFISDSAHTWLDLIIESICGMQLYICKDLTVHWCSTISQCLFSFKFHTIYYDGLTGFDCASCAMRRR